MSDEVYCCAQGAISKVQTRRLSRSRSPQAEKRAIARPGIHLTPTGNTVYPSYPFHGFDGDANSVGKGVLQTSAA